MTHPSAALAANRFGLGARPGELAAIGEDPRGWLLEQVGRPQPPSQEIAGLRSGAQVLQDFFAAQEVRNELRKAQSGQPNAAAAAVGKSIRQNVAPQYMAQAAARIRMAATTPTSFHERLVQFWSNHFAVSVDKVICLGLAGAMENEAIRPHVTGHFADLLLAAERHPAMIAYLDNQLSVGPNSQLARLAQRRRRQSERKIDINENLAREILELHTLGVHGGYTQTDVTTFAKVLTGWSIGGGRGLLGGGTPGEFFFRDNLHEPGSKTLLGRTYRQDGISQPRAVLADLARLPSTARFLSTKLVRHFIADDPPADCVDRLSRAYLDSDGHLPTVYQALIECDAAWNPAPAKFKTPQEYVYSTYRALNLVPPEQRILVAPFELLGQRPYSPGSPAGWPDTAADWDGSDALMKRIEWSVALGDRAGSLYTPERVADNALGPLASEHTLTGVRRAPSGSQALALLLLSPEFQRR